MRLPREIGPIHFVGIGGSGMSGIAEVLLTLGYTVSGSDLGSNAVTQRLADMGAIVYQGHAAENIGKADVVVTNPTHYAVALRYKDGDDAAPCVVAKGQDYLARRIRERAQACGIEIIENRPLAQALHRLCEVGDEIPQEFYQAVADILVYVYRQKQSVREGTR